MEIEQASDSDNRPDMSAVVAVVKHHLKFGWWSLLLFVALGTALEALLAFHVELYKDNQTRRLMWRLAHAHGTLLGLVHIVFALTVYCVGEVRNWKAASRLLRAASVLLPGGFFVGGLFTFGSDPGMGVFLAPLGAVFLIVAVFQIAKGVSP